MIMKNLVWNLLFSTLIFGVSQACSGSFSFNPEIATLSANSYVYIESPNYPLRYTDSTVCYWRVKAPYNYVLKYAFEPDFDIADSVFCSDDYLKLYDSYFTSSLIDDYCGSSRPLSGVTKSQYLFAKFSSDSGFFSANTHTGFKLKVTAVLESASSSLLPHTTYSTWSLSIGGILGAVFGSITFICICLVLIYCCLMSGKKNTRGAILSHRPGGNTLRPGGNTTTVNVTTQNRVGPEPMVQQPPAYGAQPQPYGAQPQPYGAGAPMPQPPPYDAGPPMPQPPPYGAGPPMPQPYPPPPGAVYPPPNAYPPPDAAYPPPPKY